jgi:DnaJ-class molecular chaperone
MTHPDDPAKPGDEAPPDTPQTAQGLCPRCGGSGQVDGASCPECDGTGTVRVNVGDA